MEVLAKSEPHPVMLVYDETQPKLFVGEELHFEG